MFNLGFSELVLLAIIALIFIGPKQLPEVARTVARLINEFRRATGDIVGTVREVGDKATREVRRTEDAVRARMNRPGSVAPKDPKLGSQESSYATDDGHGYSHREEEHIEGEDTDSVDVNFEEVTDGGHDRDVQEFVDTEVTNINFDVNTPSKQRRKTDRQEG